MLLYILEYTELWATMLPLLVLLFKKRDEHFLIPVKIYLIITLLLNSWITLAYFDVIQNNHFIYSLVAFCRLLCFTWFFVLLHIWTNRKIIWILFSGAIILIVFNFIFLEDFFTSFSSNSFSLEGIILLIFCIQYFLQKLRSDDITTEFDAALYIVMGLAIYEAVCFPVFLFFNTLINDNDLYAAQVWNIVHNIIYIVFCLFIARAFYGSTVKYPTK
jgi:hypothetical protein